MLGAIGLAESASRGRARAIESQNLSVAWEASAAAAGAIQMAERAARDLAALLRPPAATVSSVDLAPAPITPRRTRLVRVPDLARLQQAIALTSVGASPFQARRTAVIVPSASAADVLRHTLEDLCLVARWVPADADCAALGAHDWPVRAGDAAPLAIALPHIVTRAGLYRLFGDALGALPRIDPIAREVLAGAVAREVAAIGPAPPFTLRPALVAAMLELYDALHRNRRTVDDFERLVGTALESGASFDRGAARLLEETRFLAAAFRAYDVALAAAGLVDEHGLRARLLTLEAGGTPLTSVVVAVPDLAAAGDGLWPADYDLLTRVAGLESLTVVATEALLGTGYLTRLLDTLPDVEVVAFAGDQPPAPILAHRGGRSASCSSAATAKTKSRPSRGGSARRRRRRRPTARSRSSTSVRCRISTWRARSSAPTTCRGRRSMRCRSPPNRGPRRSTSC